MAQALKEAEGKVGAPIKVTGFVRYKLGEGVEKQEADFAAEVAAASGVKKLTRDPASRRGRTAKALRARLWQVSSTP